MPRAAQIRAKNAPPLSGKPAYRAILIRLLLLAAILIVFGRIIFNDWVDWDDSALIFRNPCINNPTLAGLAHEWNPYDPASFQMYNPLVYTTWWTLSHVAQLQYADVLGSKLTPQIFHAVNLIVHWLTACVVFEVLRRLKLGEWPAAAGAAVFALHPVQTEPIAWATGLKDLLSGLLAMLALWRYIIAVQSKDKERRKNYIFATLWYAAALIAKPSTVVLPLIVASFDFILFRRSLKEIAKWLWPWLVMAALITWLAVQIQHLPAIFATPKWTRPLVAMDSLAFYIYKIALPLYLSFDYGRTPAALMGEPSLHHPMYWTWIVPLTVVIIIWRIRKPEVTVAALVFFFSVLPVLGLTPFTFQYYSTVADRFVYFGMLGVAIIVALALSKYPNRASAVIVGVVLAIYSGLSFVQAGVWKDSQTLYEHAADSATRGSAVHYEILGQYKSMVAEAAWRKADRAKDDYDLPEYQKDIAIASSSFDQAIDNYETSMRLEPKDGIIYDLLGEALAFRGRWEDAIEVQKRRIANETNLSHDFREAPDVLYDTLGMLCTQAKHYDQAVDAFEHSLSFKKNAEVADRLRRARENRDATRPSAMPVS
jgi:protein O-mannosyl-transferase